MPQSPDPAAVQALRIQEHNQRNNIGAIIGAAEAINLIVPEDCDSREFVQLLMEALTGLQAYMDQVFAMLRLMTD